MAQHSLSCPKCKKAMENGAVHPPSEGFVWTADPATGASWWEKAKQRRQSRKTVTALRCSSCGLLELYARP
jgi:predicted nucleic-acid-binding Zn-ribbon protein